jgi:UDP-N-acetylglucosamine 2-epimerase (non-hydrolysing)
MNARIFTENDNQPIYFVIGTRAQFIKVAPVMRAMLDQGVPYTLIYTAQHRENIQEILDVYKLPKPDIVMYGEREANTRRAFLFWFFSILYNAIFQAPKYLPKPGILLTHGDTFTAWLAALMGKRAGCTVGHIESGCRSYNIFSPFPEEISRLITFRLSDIYFCADEWTVNNLRKYRGVKINMGANTMLDGVRYALQHPSSSHFDFEDRPFAIASIHRFENIFTSRFTEVILPILKDVARRYHLVFVLHPTTRERINSLGLLDSLTSDPNITLHARFDFIEWIKLCSKAEFVITDGGSNQEELSYLGVPTLLFRDETERQEGLGENVVVSRFDKTLINIFVDNPSQYRREPLISHAKPSEKVIQVIEGLLKSR